VVDAGGDLISCARVDGCHERVLRFAIRKAYTAATMGRSTVRFKDELLEHSRTLDDYGDPLFTTLQGGVPVRVGQQVVGAVAVGGNTVERDKGIADIAAAALLAGLDGSRS
jgi:glc operon protein GlcG